MANPEPHQWLLEIELPLWEVYSTVYLLIYSPGAHISHFFMPDTCLWAFSSILQHDFYVLMSPPSVPVPLSHTMKHKLPVKMIILVLVLKVKSNDVENMPWCDI